MLLNSAHCLFGCSRMLWYIDWYLVNSHLVFSRHVLKGHTIDRCMINFPDKKKLPGHEKCQYDSLLWSVDFSQDGGLLASTGTDSHVFVWDVKTGQQKCDFIIPNDGSAVCFVKTSRGTYLAAASAPHMTITLFSVGENSQVISVLGGHSHWVKDSTIMNQQICNNNRGHNF